MACFRRQLVQLMKHRLALHIRNNKKSSQQESLPTLPSGAESLVIPNRGPIASGNTVPFLALASLDLSKVVIVLTVLAITLGLTLLFPSKDAQEFATWVLIDYQMLSTLVSFVVLVWLRHDKFFCDCARGGMVSSALEEMAFVFGRAYSTALETNKCGMLVRANLVAAKLSPVFPKK